MKKTKLISRIIALIVCAGFVFCFNSSPAAAEATASYVHGLRQTEEQEQSYIHQDVYTSPYLVRNTNSPRTPGSTSFFGGFLPTPYAAATNLTVNTSRNVFVSASPYYALRFTAKLLYPKHWFW